MANSVIGARTGTGNEWTWGHAKKAGASRKGLRLRGKLVALILTALLALATLPALAAVPPGQQGYEGQPGNQGGG